jgi:FkbM family methyltransferase
VEAAIHAPAGKNRTIAQVIKKITSVTLMKQALSNFLLRNASLPVYFFFTRLWKLSEKKPQVNIDHVFTILSNRNKEVFFVQIGSNDGVSNDPLHAFIRKYKWKGILVEPMPGMFEVLKKNYEGVPGLQFENAGIGDTEEEKDFFCLPAEMNEPSWLQQIGTFSRDAFVKRFRLITLRQLLSKYRVKKIDLLHIDAEGYEYRILSQLESVTTLPSLILFEWGSMTEQDLQKTLELLNRYKYKIHYSGGDMLAVSKK